MPYPSPNETRSDKLIFNLFVILLVFLICSVTMSALIRIKAQMDEAEKLSSYKTHDSLTVNYTYDGEAIRTYVMIDPDTNIQYLVNDRGGMVRRDRE